MKPLLPVTRILDPREIVSLTSDMMSNNQNVSRHQSKMRCELEDQVDEKSPKLRGHQICQSRCRVMCAHIPWTNNSCKRNKWSRLLLIITSAKGHN